MYGSLAGTLDITVMVCMERSMGKQGLQVADLAAAY
jgi:hypothetical protein